MSFETIVRAARSHFGYKYETEPGEIAANEICLRINDLEVSKTDASGYLPKTYEIDLLIKTTITTDLLAHAKAKDTVLAKLLSYKGGRMLNDVRIHDFGKMSASSTVQFTTMVAMFEENICPT